MECRLVMVHVPIIPPPSSKKHDKFHAEKERIRKEERIHASVMTLFMKRGQDAIEAIKRISKGKSRKADIEGLGNYGNDLERLEILVGPNSVIQQEIDEAKDILNRLDRIKEI